MPSPSVDNGFGDMEIRTPEGGGTVLVRHAPVTGAQGPVGRPTADDHRVAGTWQRGAGPSYALSQQTGSYVPSGQDLGAVGAAAVPG